MKGLMLDNFYKSVDYMKIYSFLLVLLAILLFLNGNDSIWQAVIAVCHVMIATASLSGMREDAEVRWTKYEISLPVKRKDIIACKYASYMCGILAGVIIAAVITFSAYLIHGNVLLADGFRDVLSLFTLCIGSAVFIGALFFPLVYAAGASRSDALLLVSIVGGIGIVAFLTWLSNNILGPGVNYYLKIGFWWAVFGMAYILSYCITRKIYAGKDI